MPSPKSSGHSCSCTGPIHAEDASHPAAAITCAGRSEGSIETSYRLAWRDTMTLARHIRIATVGCEDAPRALCRSPRAVPPRLAQQAFHLPHGLGETHEDRPRHDGMTDI